MPIQNTISLLKRLMPHIFWLGFIMTIIFTMMPSQHIPDSVIFWDKAQHALAFFMLMFTGAIAYAKRLAWIAIFLLLYGASIEIMQQYFTTSRNGDILDIVADTVGVILGLIIYAIVRTILHHFDFYDPKIK